MYSDQILIDILVAQEFTQKGKEYIIRGETIVRLVSKKLDKGGTSVICFNDFKYIDFEKRTHSFKTNSPN